MQYTDDVLNGGEKFSLGDEYTVRGFKNQGISGDKGYYIKNEISYTYKNNLFGNFTLFFGYDFGHISENNITGKYKRGYLNGAAVGLKYSKGIFYLDATIAKGIYASDYVTKDKVQYYLTTGIKF